MWREIERKAETVFLPFSKPFRIGREEKNGREKYGKVEERDGKEERVSNKMEKKSEAIFLQSTESLKIF